MSSRLHIRTAFALIATVALTSWAIAQEQPAPADKEQPAEETAAEATPAEEAPAEAAAPEEGAPAEPEEEAKPVEPKKTGVVGSLSLRGLAGRLDAIKSRSEQLKARVDLLKEAVLAGGKSASATIVHRNKMGEQFRLTQLSFTVDGIRVFSQRDASGALHNKKTIDILSGPISPGTHTITVQITYRGHGYGPFKYLNKQTFTVKGSQKFKAVEGKNVSVDVLGYERKDVPLEDRPAVNFKVSKPK